MAILLPTYRAVCNQTLSHFRLPNLEATINFKIHVIIESFQSLPVIKLSLHFGNLDSRLRQRHLRVYNMDKQFAHFATVVGRIGIRTMPPSRKGNEPIKTAYFITRGCAPAVLIVARAWKGASMEGGGICDRGRQGFKRAPRFALGSAIPGSSVVWWRETRSSECRVHRWRDRGPPAR